MHLVPWAQRERDGSETREEKSKSEDLEGFELFSVGQNVCDKMEVEKIEDNLFSLLMAEEVGSALFPGRDRALKRLRAIS
jgi:hypothetical protein